ncbi:maleylpyruvate isomerase N-terminal domain-containing protein [Saccharothrix sp. NRRL B-16348]|uniref:maleylpyruvate isomerase N-terminal domain-containing protein n=1 Tax=Saccharothrix sp. NRRL B-16348 TaxID=1415542 RepID=UPI0006AFA0D1|nr:maleylpyruvate isomerase N-terminal domain-containing protein [Saccharothrix sp. NRRL B-16348]
MNTSWADLVRTAATGCAAVLTTAADRDWSSPAGEVEWTCRATLDHIAVGQVGYAGMLIAQPADRYVTLFSRLDPRAPIDRCLEALRIGGTLLASTIERTAPDVRAWHPWGRSDPSGFSAMAVLELTVHSYDIAQGLGVDWTPPDEWCPPVVERLFPHAPAGHAPARTLLWCTGRGELPGVPRQTSWRPHVAAR